MEGERNIQGFFTAYLSVPVRTLMAPEMELSHGYCDLFLMPDLMRYEVKHSYILELKYLSVKDTEEKTRTQWQEAVKQINEYAAAPRVRQLVQNTKLHCIIIQFRGWELESINCAVPSTPSKSLLISISLLCLSPRLLPVSAICLL